MLKLARTSFLTSGGQTNVQADPLG
jgi:hypothetical protein